jgi:hypothetical protein
MLPVAAEQGLHGGHQQQEVRCIRAQADAHVSTSCSPKQPVHCTAFCDPAAQAAAALLDALQLSAVCVRGITVP